MLEQRASYTSFDLRNMHSNAVSTLFESNDIFHSVLRTHEPIDYNRYHLMAQSVKPISGGPVYRATSQRFSHITVDVTSAKNVEKQYVLFIATESGNVLKLSVLPRLDGACLIEKWRLQDEKGGFDVLKMQFVKETVSIFQDQSVKTVVKGLF